MKTISEKSLKSTKSGHEREKMFGCEICGKSLSSNTKLTQHIATIHEGKKPFTCEMCDYSCSQKGTMNRHVASVHEENRKFAKKAASKIIK